MDMDKLFESQSLDGVADSVFGAVNNSVSEVKEMQKKKVAENVQIVVQALKKIETDIRDRFDNVGNALEKRIITIKDGRDGIDGRDGKNGKDGRNGRDGLPGAKGADGKNGRDGIDGVDGVSVTNARIDFDGSLIITLSNGQELNVGEVMPVQLAESIKIISGGGGDSQTVLDTLVSLQAQITALSPAAVYKGTWNASTNTPTLTSSVGTTGNFYIVSTAGSTNLNGVTNWGVGDWAIFNSSTWQRVEGGADGNFVNLTTTGNVTLGDAVGDTITVNGATTFVNATPILTTATASRAVFTDASKQLVSNAITGTGNVVMSASPTLTGTVAGASLSLSSLTSGRVTYAGTSGLLQDSANLVFNGTGLGIGETTANIASSLSITASLPYASITGITAGQFGLQLKTGASDAVGVLSGGLTYNAATGEQRIIGAQSYVYQTIYSGGSERVRINTSGNVGIGVTSPACILDISGASGGQIKFPATQNLSSDANTLDDYEEGTWTPNVTFGGGSTGITYAGYQGGKYTRIGNRVFFTAQMRLTNKGSSTGNASITGLPFASAGGNQGIGSVCFFVDSLTFTTTVGGQVDLDAATISIYSVVSGGSSTLLTNAEFANTTNIKMMGHYYTTA